MNLEELTWFNQQLAAMLREGVPMPDALRQLTQAQSRGALRNEFQRVESALAAGTPLDRAVAGGSLPPLYVSLVQAGVRSGDLPGALVLAADHYAALNTTWRRAKALLLYPAVVIVLGLTLSVLLWCMYSMADNSITELLGESSQARTQVALTFVPALFALAAIGAVAVAAVPAIRNQLVWLLPGFREARTANFASASALLLQHGCPLPETLALMQELEKGSPAEKDLARWRARLEAGHTRDAARAEDWDALPSLLGWFLPSAGGNLADGFARAGRFYRERAIHRLDLLLHGFMPIILVVLGLLVTSQLFGILLILVRLVDKLGAE